MAKGDEMNRVDVQKVIEEYLKSKVGISKFSSKPPVDIEEIKQFAKQLTEALEKAGADYESKM